MWQPFLNVREVAQCLHVSVRTVWRWQARGKLPPPLRIGKIVRWRRRDIEELADRETIFRMPGQPA